MVYSVILHVPRKAGISLEEFKQYWENSHIPLLKRLVGHEFPLSHTRHYIERLADPPQIDPTLRPSGVAVAETVGSVEVDGVAVLTFATKDHYERFTGKLADTKKRRSYEEDLNRFVDIQAMRGMVAVSGFVHSNTTY